MAVTAKDSCWWQRRRPALRRHGNDSIDGGNGNDNLFGGNATTRSLVATGNDHFAGEAGTIP